MGFFSGLKRLPYEEHIESLSPLIGARSCRAVSPSDTDDLPGGVCRYVYAGGAGNISILFADDDPGNDGPQVIAFAAGEIKAIHGRRIYSTSTTATTIKAMY